MQILNIKYADLQVNSNLQTKYSQMTSNDEYGVLLVQQEYPNPYMEIGQFLVPLFENLCDQEKENRHFE